MRAPRFPLHMAVRFRRTGDSGWLEGQTENISCSGVLFRVDNALPDKANVELRLALPLEWGRVQPPEVFCRGRVVRTVSIPDDALSFGAVVRIEDYDFLPSH